MKKLALVLCLMACGDAEEAPPDATPPYTWGDLAEGVTTAYCNALVDPCRYSVDVEFCVKHNAWHLCETDGTCDAPVEQAAAEEALAACAEALASSDDTECYLMRSYGVVPEECQAVFDLKPQLQDGGPG